MLHDDISEIGMRARRRIAIRLLPFVFVMYVICYVDRANVSFANLRMSAELGFSDTAYGLGVGMFFLGYILFEIPGSIIVERWSARKWLARIMITWGLATIFNGFVRTPAQFYTVRFFVGVAEASFFLASSSTLRTGSDTRIGPRPSHRFTQLFLQLPLQVPLLRLGYWEYIGEGSADGAGSS